MSVVDFANLLSFSNDLSGRASWVLSACAEVIVGSFAVHSLHAMLSRGQPFP